MPRLNDYVCLSNHFQRFGTACGIYLSQGQWREDGLFEVKRLRLNDYVCLGKPSSSIELRLKTTMSVWANISTDLAGYAIFIKRGTLLRRSWTAQVWTTICLSELTSSSIGESMGFSSEEGLRFDEVERLRFERLCLSEQISSSTGEILGFFLGEGKWFEEVERLSFEQLSVCLSYIFIDRGEHGVFISGGILSDEVECLRFEWLCLSEQTFSSIGEGMGYSLEEGLWGPMELNGSGWNDFVCLSKHLHWLGRVFVFH